MVLEQHRVLCAAACVRGVRRVRGKLGEHGRFSRNAFFDDQPRDAQDLCWTRERDTMIAVLAVPTYWFAFKYSHSAHGKNAGESSDMIDFVGADHVSRSAAYYASCASEASEDAWARHASILAITQR